MLILAAWPGILPAGAQSIPAPTAPADSAIGQEIFSARCATCHGDTGLGDGPQASASINPPMPIGTADYLRTAVPAEMYGVISGGRMEAGMPPFVTGNSNPLSDAEIWAVIAAAYSYGTSTDTIATGAAAYEASCTSCHGEDGRGVPELDLTDLSYWSVNSNQTVLERLPAVAEHTYDALDAESEAALIDYLRTFSYDYFDPALRFTPIPEVVVSGQVTNGTTGDPAPGGLTATVSIFSNFAIQDEYTTTVSATGTYSLTLTDVMADWALISAVDYAGVNYTSGVTQASHTIPTVELPVNIYETTTDDTVLNIDQLHMVLAFVNDAIEVAELYSVSNNSLMVYVGQDGEPEAGTVILGLPAGATNISWERGLGGASSFLPAPEVVQQGAGWTDTVPVRPGRGSHTLLVRYQLPYDGELNLAHPVTYGVSNVSVAMPDAGVTIVEDGQWSFQGNLTVSGQQIANYSGGTVPAGSSLRLTLEGEPRQVVNSAGNALLVRDHNTEIIVGSIALVLTLVGGGFLARQWQQPTRHTGDADADELLDAIADLDDAYAAGEIPDGRYRRQRERLKAALRELWE
ncbi:MAG: c-type cytochrome [Anaerolineales bacterium]|nr:c-type cytochrome [Anaerolineales bacterium]MCB8958776.1 c-type cytochrome [Ardenticatenales bacterium]